MRPTYHSQHQAGRLTQHYIMACTALAYYPFLALMSYPAFYNCMSAIIRKLFKLLIRDTSLSVEIAQRWEEILTTRKIKLSAGTEGKTFKERVKSSQWG